MDEIRPWLFIGGYRDINHDWLLSQKNIGAILQMVELSSVPGITTLYIEVEDEAPIQRSMLRQGVDFILKHKKAGDRILVACGAGVSRSSAFCIAALREVEGMSLIDAFREVHRWHPESMPNEAVWDSLCEYYKEPTPYLEVFKALISKTAR